MKKAILNCKIPVLAYALLAIASRLIAHPPGMSALIGFALLCGQQLRWPIAIALVLLTALCADVIIIASSHFDLFAGWLVLNYSAYVCVVLLGARLRQRQKPLAIAGLIALSSLGFWLWTNLGVWLSSGMYPLSSQGFIECYTLALPFLRNALLGDVLWWLLFLTTQRLMQNSQATLLPRLQLTIGR